MRTTIALAALLFLACVPVGRLKARAAFDLECPEAQLEIVDLDGTTKGVRGCGSKATYLWVCGQNQTCAWVMNTDARATPEN